MIEFVKNYLVKIEPLCHAQKPYLQSHYGQKILVYLNLIPKELVNKDDYKNAFSLDKITQLLNPLSQYTYDSITNDYSVTNHSF